MCRCVYKQQSERNFVTQVGSKQINRMNILLSEFGRHPKKSNRKEPNAFLRNRMTIQLTSTCEYVFLIKQIHSMACISVLGHAQAGTSISKDAYLRQFHNYYWHFGSISRSCIQYFTNGRPFLEPAPRARWMSLSASLRRCVDVLLADRWLERREFQVWTAALPAERQALELLNGSLGRMWKKLMWNLFSQSEALFPFGSMIISRLLWLFISRVLTSLLQS